MGSHDLQGDLQALATAASSISAMSRLLRTRMSATSEFAALKIHGA